MTRGMLSMVISSSLSIPYAPMPPNKALNIWMNYTASSSTASSTSAASTTKHWVSAKSWKPLKTKRWLYLKGS